MATDSQPRPRLTPKGQRTRARIIDAAAELIHERGVPGTTLEDVKAAAQVSGSQLYHYFDDKDALVQAVIDRQADILVSTTERADLGTAGALRAWRDLVAGFATDAPHIFGLLGSPMPSFAAAGVVWKAWRERGSAWLFETLRLLLATPRDFLDARFSHPKVKAMMAAWGLHLDFAPDVAGGALFPYLECMVNQSFGMVIGKGGANTIVSAMVGMLKAKGGEVILGAPVALTAWEQQQAQRTKRASLTTTNTNAIAQGFGVRCDF